MQIEENLLALAKHLSVAAAGSVSARRAVSTAYYAVFHALARLCADELVGPGASLGPDADYEKVYRAIEHGSMKAKFLGVPRELDAIRQIGNRFVLLQSKRHDADYRTSSFEFGDGETSDLLDAARQAIDVINRLSPHERKALAVRLIIKDRSS